jgi:hypothetical protein
LRRSGDLVTFTKKRALYQSHDQETVRGITVKKENSIRVFQSFEEKLPVYTEKGLPVPDMI